MKITSTVGVRIDEGVPFSERRSMGGPSPQQVWKSFWSNASDEAGNRNYSGEANGFGYNSMEFVAFDGAGLVVAFHQIGN